MLEKKDLKTTTIDEKILVGNATEMTRELFFISMGATGASFKSIYSPHIRKMKLMLLEEKMMSEFEKTNSNADEISSRLKTHIEQSKYVQLEFARTLEQIKQSCSRG